MSYGKALDIGDRIWKISLDQLSHCIKCTIFQPPEQGDTSDDELPRIMTIYVVPAAK